MDTNDAKKLKITTIIYATIIILIIYLLAIGTLIYGFGINNRITAATIKYIPYPAALVNNNFIKLKDVNDDVQSVRKFYESQDFSKVGLRVDFSTDDGKKRLKIKEREVLNKMIEDKAIEILARKNGIKITKDLVDQAVSRKLSEYSGSDEAVKDDLNRFYGWTINDFKDKIVKASLYKEELGKIFNEDAKDANQQARDKIEKALKDLNDKKDFAEVAKKYSEGATAQAGGEMGWYKKDQIIPVLADVVFSLETGKTSGIIESELGFHIAQLEERKKENDEELVRFRQVFVRKKYFADWLGEKMKGLDIKIPLKDYYWNKESLSAEFKDQGLKDFEKNLMENSQGDASIIF